MQHVMKLKRPPHSLMVLVLVLSLNWVLVSHGQVRLTIIIKLTPLLHQAMEVVSNSSAFFPHVLFPHKLISNALFWRV